MTDVFYSISPFGTGDIQTGSGNITVTAGGVAEFSVAQTGNIGVGCCVEYNSIVSYISEMTDSTHAKLITATGGTPANQSLTAVTSIHHVWASLSAAQAAYSGASFLNTTDLVTATTNVYLACYYDHDDQTADAGFYFSGATVNSTYYVTVFTPQGGTESINNQRHTGKWDSTKYITESNSSTVAQSEDDYLKIDGLQISRTGSTSSYAYAVFSTATNHGSISNSIVKTAGNTAIRGFSPDNCVIYSTAGTLTARGVYDCSSIEYCTIYGFDRGIYASSADAKNCIVFGNNTDFHAINSADYCASDDGTGTNAVTLGTYSSIFTDYSNGDFSLLNFTGTGAVIEQGDPISGITTDIIGTTRDAATPDIGAFEYATTGPSYYDYAFTETTEASETITDKYINNESISELSETVESISELALFIEQITESSILSDLETQDFIISESISDTVEASEGMSDLIIYKIELSENVSASDLIETLGIFGEVFTEYVIGSDSSTGSDREYISGPISILVSSRKPVFKVATRQAIYHVHMRKPQYKIGVQ